MEEKNKNRIYIELNEEITSIISKLKKCSGEDVTLVVPKRAMMLQNVLNLKILQHEAEALKKNISIVTVDESESKAFVEKEKDDVERKIRVREESEYIKQAGSDFGPMAEKNAGKESSGEGSHEARENGALPHSDLKNRIKVSDIVRKNKKSDYIREKNEAAEPIVSIQTPENIEKEFRQRKENVLLKSKKNLPVSSSKNIERKVSILPSVSSKFFAAFFVLCLAVLVIASIFIINLVFTKADVVIALKTEAMSQNYEIIGDDFLNEIDALNNKIPMEKKEISNEESGSYPATGKKHITTKASGKITIFNEYSSNPQKLVADTRFLSKDGHLFRIKDSVTIPGFSRIEGKDIPGQVEATVYADKPGEEYNIGKDSFTLPGLQGSAKYTSIYARSYEAMTGGADKEVLYFSESDYLTAKEKLLSSAAEKNKIDFSNSISSGEMLLEDTKKENDVKVESNVKTGDVVENFEMKVIVTTSAYTIKKDDLNKLIDEKISLKLSQDKEFVKDSRKYEVEDVVKNDDGKIKILVFASQNFVTKLNIENIKKEIAGKNRTELEKYFNNVEGVKSVDFNLSPRWTENIPSAYDKINITIDTNSSI